MSTITVNGLDDFPLVFQELAAQFNEFDYTGILATITEVLEAKHADHFATESGPTGERWQPWFFRGIDAQDNHPTLDVTGVLKGSLIAGRAGHVQRIHGNQLEWGTNIDYARIHNEGGTIVTGIPLVGRGGVVYLPAGSTLNIPQREFVGLDEPVTDEITQLVAEHVIEELANV